MSSSHPPTFENYPEPPPEHATPDPTEQHPAAASDWTPITSAPIAPPQWPAVSRRNVLQVAGFGVAGVIGVSLFAAQRNGSNAWPEGMPSEFDPGGGEPDDTDQGGSVDVGDYTIDFPEGWTITAETDTTALITNGATTMLFRAYQAGDDATAVGEAARLLKKYATELRRPGAVTTKDQSTAEVDVGVATRSGTIDAKPGDAEAWVSISREAEDALAVITLVPDAASSKVKREVISMRKQFLDR